MCLFASVRPNPIARLLDTDCGLNALVVIKLVGLITFFAVEQIFAYGCTNEPPNGRKR
jgi:hypothetical protein